MTGLELPLAGILGILGTAAGAGGTYAVTRHQAKANELDIKAIKAELAAHTASDAKALNDIMRSLGRIEGTLQELKRSN